ncbi:hypothetical protein BFU36_08685 [Sulfolobus sp. A20]|uniref:PaREP1 family protein n=1 Tax=Saccharolobus sp. A20 TaxID=1891280 RepID=UPI000845FF26|nr:PaREP1 family protein [Sulfolobus sp. A20]TRM75199.1 hypothetical protein DJ532_10865 [Sulfolobus sp. A20-N-F8]TRM79651.1 hypothetical protein DJ528_00175 [Sulfolobus sp. B5]TRM79827.1 hypothetical protein DJ524_09405 [Sulfolobus sp. D5]TRM84436.1 hypothetical protein DJ522_04780 [Sulfolobus sp. F3]TRM88375.1 hypothetical protein DJ521_01955 [Sulfolobus sp. E3]TRN00503.1 hypothetical protein DJ530_07465 [Sulfolobus sp. E1]
MGESSKILTASDVLIEEADDLLSKGDITQASEKYYKAAEESIKLLVKILDIKEIMEKVEKDGYWDLGTLDEAVQKISEKVKKSEVFEYWMSAVAILTANLSVDELENEAKEVRKLVRIADEIVNSGMA